MRLTQYVSTVVNLDYVKFVAIKPEVDYRFYRCAQNAHFSASRLWWTFSHGSSQKPELRYKALTLYADFREVQTSHFFTDFHQILYAARKIGSFQGYCF